MALSIGVTEGSRITVGKSMLTVLGITNGTHVSINYAGKQHLITIDERTEVEPNVFISCGGRDTKYAHYSRLAFEADRAIPIKRVPAVATV
jgi:phage gp45-like